MIEIAILLFLKLELNCVFVKVLKNNVFFVLTENSVYRSNC